jgi:hypothetical protein
MSDMEGKVTRVGASKRGQRTSFKTTSESPALRRQSDDTWKLIMGVQMGANKKEGLRILQTKPPNPNNQKNLER